MTEYEIEEKLEIFKSSLELFKSKLEDARNTIKARDIQIEDIEKDKKVLQGLCEERLTEIEKLKKENEDTQKYQQDNTILQNLNNSQKEKIEKLENEIAELEEAAEINKQVEALNQLRDEAQKAKENSDELYNENGKLKAQIASMELAYQELDLAKVGLENKLEKEKSKNKSIAEESLSNKTKIDKERAKLSKKIEDIKKLLKDSNTLLDAKTAECESLKKEYESLQVAYASEKEKVKSLKEKSSHNIISIPTSENKAIIHYNLGPTSESVMSKFIEVIQKSFSNSEYKNGLYYIKPFTKAAEELGFNKNDSEVINTRLLDMKSPSGDSLVTSNSSDSFSTYLNLEEFINWISKIKDK